MNFTHLDQVILYILVIVTPFIIVAVFWLLLETNDHDIKIQKLRCKSLIQEDEITLSKRKEISQGCDRQTDQFVQYIGLRKENERLKQENGELKEKLVKTMNEMKNIKYGWKGSNEIADQLRKENKELKRKIYANDKGRIRIFTSN